MDEVLEYNRKTLTDVYMKEVENRTEDVEHKVSFLRDQLMKNEDSTNLQLEVIRDRGRHLKEEVDALVTEFETKCYEMKTTRTEHITNMEKDYSSFLSQLQTESAKCSDVCDSGSLQEVETIIKSLDKLLNQTSLPNIELREHFFEPVQTAATELKNLFGKFCSKDILIPEGRVESLDKAPLLEMNMDDNSDINSLLDSEHPATPKSTSIQGDIASEKSFETSAKSDHGDFEDLDDKAEDSVGDSTINYDMSASAVDSDNLSEQKISEPSKSVHGAVDSEDEMISANVDSVPGQKIVVSERILHTPDESKPESGAKDPSDKDNKSVEKSAAEDFVEETLDMTDTSEILGKEGDGNMLRDTEEEAESEKSKYSYASSYEEVASSKTSNNSKVKDNVDMISEVKDNIVKDTVEGSLVGNAESKEDVCDSETPVKSIEIKSGQEDSLASGTVENPLREASIPFDVKTIKQDSPDGTLDEQFGHSNVTENIGVEANYNAKSNALFHSVPTTQEAREVTDGSTKEVVEQNDVSKEHPKENVQTYVKETEVSKHKAEDTHKEPDISTEQRDDMFEREGLNEGRSSIDVGSEEDGVPPVKTTPAETQDILEVLHTFKVKGGDEVISICPLSSGECAWIARQKGKHVFRAIKMVSRFGKVVQTSGFPRAVVDISVDRTDGILVTCTDSVVRQMLAVDKSVVKFETDEDLTSLCQLSTGNTVVCHYLTSRVALIDPKGNVLECLDGKGRHRPLIGNPWKVRANESNDDIIIINRQGPSSIVVVDKELNLRFLFDGKITYTAANIHDFNSSASPRETTSATVTASCSINDNRFIPVDACFDPSNNIIIAEHNRKAVLVLDAEGQLLGTLFNECTRPTSLAIDSQGHLWVGYVNGKIDIIRHLSEKINWLK